MRVRCAGFKLWDMKLSPASENTAANEVLVLEVALIVDDVVSIGLLETDSWRLFARAFSCWRMKLARLYRWSGFSE